MTALHTELSRLTFPDVPDFGPERCGLLGEHPAMLEVFRLMALAAPTLAPVLIFGEPGTEREAIARCLHKNSVLANGPWMAFDCSKYSARELEEGLFGEESVSETGTVARRPGCLEQSRGGTLFLDDITQLTLPLQQRLLRALQTPRIERRRHGDARASEIRIVAGASRSLREALTANTFREELYLRLAVVTLHVPRLADRGTDLLLLTAQTVATLAQRNGNSEMNVSGIAADAYTLLKSHTWPDNVRELRSVIEHAALAARTDTIRLQDLPTDFRSAAHEPTRHDATALPSLSEMESRHIALVLQETHGVIHRAADILGVHRNTLTRKIRQYGIQMVNAGGD